MKITGLRLAGFKSFVEPTELKIQPGLTGVVGPNGCGKSNLLEAIRWVMGEGSPKSLRGGGMEDVIFAGTTTRPARSFAEVMLVCEDPGAALSGLVNDEVGDRLEVVRRIERGAGSAYRANGRDVRARDVALIFADAATGAHSPALVSQGKIAAVIAARPTERRAMLEEAAGIAGMHVRRKDAETRLRATEANLARLNELVGDMDNRAASLRRQAKAAEKYRALSSAIRLHEARVIFARWRDAAAASDAASADARAASAAAASAQQAVQAGAAAQQAAAVQLASLRAAGQAARDSAAATRAALAEAEAAAASAEARLADLAAQIVGISDDRAREGDLARAAQDALARLDADSQQLAASLAAHGRARTALVNADTASQAALRDAEVALAGASAEAARDDAEQRIARSALAAATAMAERAERDAARHQADLAALGDGEALAADLAAASAAAAEAEAQAAATEAAASASEAARTAAAAAASAAAAARAEAEAAAAALASETAALARALDRSDGAAAPVLNQIVAAPGHEAALAAALGDDLNAGMDPAAPRRWPVTGADADAAAALPPGTRALAEFVTAPAALAARLAQIAVADADTGQPLSPGQRLVTRDGTMRRWDGYQTSGDGGTAAERLRRTNRLAALTAENQTAAAVAAQRAAAADTARAQLAAADAAASAARTARAEADTALRAALRTADQARGALDQYQARRTALTARSADIAAAAVQARDDLAARTADLAALPGDGLARARLAEAQAVASDCRAAAAAARAAITAHDAEAAALTQRRAIAVNDQKSWRARAGDAARRLDAMDGREAELAAQQTALAPQPAAHRSRATALLGEAGAATAAAAAAAEAEAACAAEMAAIEARLADAREAEALARETRAGAAARAENAESRRVEMGRLAGERFGCPPPLLPKQVDFAAETVSDAAAEGAQHDQLTADRERLGPVNLVAADELATLDAERAASAAEIAELAEAVARLRGSIGALNREGRTRLLAAFTEVDGHFQRLFATLFGGGKAHLELVDADDPLEAGLEIMAQPPGKRLATLTLLSGGEQALTAIALIFALFLTNPAPICVLDEVDAPLDDANVERFCGLLDRMARDTATRYLIVTHNPVTMARMHRLFGVTMVEPGVSRLVSVDLGGAEALLSQ